MKTPKFKDFITESPEKKESYKLLVITDEPAKQKLFTQQID